MFYRGIQEGLLYVFLTGPCISALSLPSASCSVRSPGTQRSLGQPQENHTSEPRQINRRPSIQHGRHSPAPPTAGPRWLNKQQQQAKTKTHPHLGQQKSNNGLGNPGAQTRLELPEYKGEKRARPWERVSGRELSGQRWARGLLVFKSPLNDSTFQK